MSTELRYILQCTLLCYSPRTCPMGCNVLVVECEDVDQFEGVVVSFVSWTCSTEPLSFTLNGPTLLVTGRVDYEEVA